MTAAETSTLTSEAAFKQFAHEYSNRLSNDQLDRGVLDCTATHRRYSDVISSNRRTSIATASTPTGEEHKQNDAS